jgi:hypothetical protein
MVGCLFTLGLMHDASAQNTQPSPTPAEGRYVITASVEGGVRGYDVDGSRNKFRSDLNYKAGFRLFDSSVMIEDNGPGMKVFDTFLATSSGWGSDPSGSLRVKMDRSGIYSFDSNVRSVKYYNNLNNFALNEHNADLKHNFGDADLTIFPERESFRMRFGYSFNNTRGSGSSTTRAYSDEFPIDSFVRSRSNDFRAAVEGKVLGFNLSLSHGYRVFRDQTHYILLAPSLGNNPTNNGRLFTFQRSYPIKGSSHFTIFSAQRTFAKKLDFTTRWIYSSTDTHFTLEESITGRDNSNNQVDLDRFLVNGDAKRPQTRGDVGATWMVTSKFRISNSFTFDRFNISGGNLFAEAFYTRSAAGVPRPTVFTNTRAHRVTSYKRVADTIEADYQFNASVGFNIGYRFSHREVTLMGFDRNFASATPTVFTEDFNNSTNTVIAGMRIKPVKNWTIYWDVEHGKADNVFTRLANYDFTNFRIRSRAHFKKFALNLSAIFKDNNNPGRAEDSTRDFAVDSTSRTFSGSLDWTPIDEIALSGGYTYQNQTSESAILVPIAGVSTEGVSQYFVRDSYAFFDISARPIKRISLYASYRIDDDRGQGDRFSLLPQNIISSYPMTFHSPEARVTVRVTKNIDWNVGYQFYDYHEKFQATQNYRAHLPYTSLRIYWGAKAGDR